MAVVATVGLGQMLVEGGRREDNLRRAQDMIDLAGRNGCAVVVLPECCDLGWTHPSALDLAEPIPGDHSDLLCRAAADAEVYVAAGLTERSDRRIYNAAVLIAPSGEILLHHRKINVLSIAQDLYTAGDRLGVAESKFGRIGLNICADNFPNSLAIGHTLCRMGARIVVSPSAWAVDADHDNERDPYGDLWLGAYRELARLYGTAVLGVSNVGWMSAGPWQGKKCIGCSMAVDCRGEVAALAPYGVDAEGLVIADVGLSEAESTGTDIAQMLMNKGYTGP